MWGIGKLTQAKQKIYSSHPSATFFSRRIVKKTKNHQKQVFLKPFFDVSYVGFGFNTEKFHFLDIPLVIIGITQIRGMNVSEGNQRNLLLKYIEYIEYTKLKAPTFINCATDMHLKVLYRNGVNNTFNCRIPRTDFYIRHLLHIISDKPWTSNTLKDIFECMPALLYSLIYIESHRVIITKGVKLIFKYLKKKVFKNMDLTNVEDEEPKKYSNINEYAEDIYRILINNSEGQG